MDHIEQTLERARRLAATTLDWRRPETLYGREVMARTPFRRRHVVAAICEIEDLVGRLKAGCGGMAGHLVRARNSQALTTHRRRYPEHAARIIAEIHPDLDREKEERERQRERDRVAALIARASRPALGTEALLRRSREAWIAAGGAPDPD